MARTIVQETDASVTLGGTWTVQTDVRSNAGYKQSTVAGATITVAVASGKSGVILTGVRGSALTFTATLDGVPLVDPISGTTTFSRNNAGAAALNNAQNLSPGAPTAGTATVSLLLNGTTYTSAAVAWNATAATVAAAVQAALPAGATITGSGGPWPATQATLTATGNLAATNLNAYTINGAGLTGGAPVVTNVQVGQSASWWRCAFLHTVVAAGTTHTLVVTLVSGTLTLDEVETFTAETPTAGRFTVAGHSIAAGIGATPSSARFSLVLAGYLGLTEDNQALSGEGLAFGNAAIAFPGWLRLNPTSGASLWHDEKPQVALVMYGYNDVRTNPDATAATTTGPNLAHFVQRLREMLVRMQYDVPACKVALLGINYGASGVVAQGWQQTNFAAATAPYGPTWSTAMAMLCGEAGIANAVYCDIFPAIAYNGDVALMVDGSHPNAAGHGLMATALYRRMQAAILGAGATRTRRGGPFG